MEFSKQKKLTIQNDIDNKAGITFQSMKLFKKKAIEVIGKKEQECHD